MAKDVSELNLPRGISITFPEGKDKLLHFEIRLRPDEGLYSCVWAGGREEAGF